MFDQCNVYISKNKQSLLLLFIYWTLWHNHWWFESRGEINKGIWLKLYSIVSFIHWIDLYLTMKYCACAVHDRLHSSLLARKDVLVVVKPFVFLRIHARSFGVRTWGAVGSWTGRTDEPEASLVQHVERLFEKDVLEEEARRVAVVVSTVRVTTFIESILKHLRGHKVTIVSQVIVIPLILNTMYHTANLLFLIKRFCVWSFIDSISKHLPCFEKLLMKLYTQNLLIKKQGYISSTSNTLSTKNDISYTNLWGLIL